ncbi:MAG: hypothetical protein ACYS8X_00860 [Planctomycetota bacterium]
MATPRQRPIWIGCPQHGKLVRGMCDCDRAGRYIRASDGAFAIQHVQCTQDGGRCMQTLCILHRFNRGGAASWYPSALLATPEHANPSRRQRRSPPAPKSPSSSTDIVA